MSDGYTIGTLARAAGVNVETVRYYQRRALLPTPAKPLGGTRRYWNAELARLRFIKAAQALGFALEEIRELIRLEDGTHCTEARRIAERKLELIRSRLRQLREMEQALEALIVDCDDEHGHVRCPLIERLAASGREPAASDGSVTSTSGPS